MMKPAITKQHGFTLIELMVSVAIFAIVIVIAFGAIMTTVDVNRKSQTLTTVMNDLNFTLESMTRTIKTATQINIINAANDLYEFRDQRTSANYVQYRRDGDKIVKCESDVADECNFPSDFIPIVSDQIVITNFTLDLFNGVDERQPRFLMLVEGYAKITDRIQSDFSIQTTVSPRTVNFGTQFINDTP